MVKIGPRLSIIPADAAFDPAVTGPMYRLLGVLAARANRHGRCWPSIAKIAEDMHIGERWVNRILGQLLETPYLSTTHRPGHSTVYRIKGVNSETTPDLRDHPWSEGPPTPGVRDHPPLVSGTTQKDTKKDTKKDTNTADEIFERFWRAYPNRKPHPHPKKPARDKFRAVLKKGADVEAIIRGAENYAAYIRQEGKEPKWIASATKFLNQEYWTDYQSRPDLDNPAKVLDGNHYPKRSSPTGGDGEIRNPFAVAALEDRAIDAEASPRDDPTGPESRGGGPSG